MAFCIYCGHVVKEGTRFCGNCGKPINQAYFNAANQSEEQTVIPNNEDINPIVSQNSHLESGDTQENTLKGHINESVSPESKVDNPMSMIGSDVERSEKKETLGSLISYYEFLDDTNEAELVSMNHKDEEIVLPVFEADELAEIPGISLHEQEQSINSIPAEKSAIPKESVEFAPIPEENDLIGISTNDTPEQQIYDDYDDYDTSVVKIAGLNEVIIKQQESNNTSIQQETKKDEGVVDVSDLDEKKRKLFEAREKDRTTAENINLWSLLQKDAKRQKYFTKENSEISLDTFAAKLDKKMVENEIPAIIKNSFIRWDDSKNKTPWLSIKPTVSVANPFTYLIQLDHIGKFTFIEEKSFITPPRLPARPGEKRALNGNGNYTATITWGVIMAIAGLIMLAMKMTTIGTILMTIGVITAIAGYAKGSEHRETIAYNARVDAERRAWNKAWDDWEDTSFRHAYQESTNGKLSRIFEAVYECIIQVCKEEFGETEMKESDDSNTMSELEGLIARRKDEYR